MLYRQTPDDNKLANINGFEKIKFMPYNFNS